MSEREGNLLFPVFLKLEQLNLLIVGGGNVGLEKITAVLKNSPSTHITLVSSIISDEIKALVPLYTGIVLLERPYQTADLEDKDLVIVATDDRSLNATIKKEAKIKKILANVADTPDLCDFYLGSIVKKGDLKIAISTNGKSPTLAKRMRQFFEKSLPETTQQILDNLSNIRSQIQGDFADKVNALNDLTASFVNDSRANEKLLKKTVDTSSIDIDALNKKYAVLSVEDRIKELYKDFAPEHILLTSSFAGNSAVLLHLFSTLTQSKQRVHFIDTGYHFKETLAYKEKLTDLYNLEIVELKADYWKNKFTRDYALWQKDPDLCCQVNKNEPLDAIKPEYQVWVSGLMHSQNEHRKGLQLFERKNGIIKFHPILDMTAEERDTYIIKYDLPLHSLALEGYGSIGCTHCTVKGTGREGRWFGSAKTECGLHI